MSKKHKIKFWDVIIGVIFVISFLDQIETKRAAYNKEFLNLADGFTLSAYNVVLDVKENNEVYVTENITANWHTTNKHGIYKFIPQWLEYTGQDNKTIKRKSIVSNLISISDPYETDTVKKKARIKIGDANEYVSLGEKQYTIEYTYDMGRDPFKGFDEFIFHAYGDYWGTEIKNPTLQINMPKSIEGYKVSFYADKYRKENVTEYVDYQVKGNTLYATFNDKDYRPPQIEEYCKNDWNVVDGECVLPSYYDTGLTKSLTVDIELPEGYFTGGNWNYGFKSLFISIAIFIITILTIYRWYKYGKDYPKRAKTVEFYPPENYNSAEIGYIYGKQSSKKLTISLIISLASKGYIKINDLKDKGNNIQIINLMAEPKKPPTINSLVGRRNIEIEKLKEADSELSKKETEIMEKYFKNGNIKKIDYNIDKFLAVKDKLVDNGYIRILSDNEEKRMEKFEDYKSDYEEQQNKYEMELKKHNNDLEKLPKLSPLESTVYSRLFQHMDTVILSEHTTFYKAFTDVDNYLSKEFKDIIIDKNSTLKMLMSIVITILVIVLFSVSYFVLEDLDPSWNIIYVLSFACIFINLFFTLLMKRKTEYGEEIIAKVKGFREFLIKVEKSKLEELVADDPSYFYNILPYTYVLNISKKWISKFENIKMPEIDMGTFDFDSIRSLSEIYDNVYYPKSTSSSNSGSSCGGGCSSCGGGCSSCGGGGSW